MQLNKYIRDLRKLGYTLSLKKGVYFAYNKQTNHEVYGTTLHGLCNYLLKSLQNARLQ
jgi:hypothetical protein